MASMNRKRTQRGITIYLGVLSLVMIVPMVGLVIDVGILYSAKSRLQAAVDGASLAAARALNLGQTTAAQASQARQNAINWFYANFPSGNWSTTNTIMDTSTVQVFDDPNNANLRDVNVTATTTVPTWFMRWFNLTSTTITAQGFASRRDVVAMMVLDRSGSMCAPGSQPCSAASSTSCGAMVKAAKLFTGQFAEGRDHIGLISFSDGAYLHTSPTTTFQTTLGYSNASGSGNGALDTINCNGGTGTAEAISLAYNQLYQTMLPGALNLVVLETDGLPNTLAYNFWDGSSAATSNASTCQDASGRTKSSGGWRTLASMRQWTNGYNMNTPASGYMSNIPPGAIGSFYTADPSQGTYFYVMMNPWQTGASSTSNTIWLSSAPGCTFASGSSTNYSDFSWLPSADVFGNQVHPTNAYKSIAFSSNHIPLTGSNATDWPNAHGGALNAADNAAYNVRTNATLPAYMFVIGLAGNSGDPPDPILLQRMANDPNGDLYNSHSPPYYYACSSEPTCISYSMQPQGTFIYAPDSSHLNQAFLTLSSQVLRLSR